MPRRIRSRLAWIFVIGILTLLSCIGIALIYTSGKPGSVLGLTGYIAMGLGLLTAIVRGVGLALLVLHDRRSD